MSFEGPSRESPFSGPRSASPSSTPTGETTPAAAARELLRPGRTASAPPASLVPPPPPPPDHPSSPTTSSSSSLFSLFSLAPSPSPVSTVYPPAPAWVSSEINRNELAPTPVLHGPAAAAGVPDVSGRSKPGFAGSRPGDDPPMHTPPSPRRPPFRRSARTYEYQAATPRSHNLKLSDLAHSHSNGSNANEPLTPGAMLGRLVEEHNHGATKRHFLHKGSIPRDTAADGTAASPPPGSPAPVDTPSPSSPHSALFPLQQSDLVELLNQDDRPTFVVDGTSTANSGPGPLHVSFANAALQAMPSVLSRISTTGHSPETGSPGPEDDYAGFKAWVLGPGWPVKEEQREQAAETAPKRNSSAAASPSSTFAGWKWAASSLRRRFRVIRATSAAWPAAEANTPAASTIAGAAAEITSQEPVSDRTTTHFPIAPCKCTTRSPSDFNSLPIPKSVGAALSFDWTRIAMSDDMPAHIKFARSVDWQSTPFGPIEHWPLDLRFVANLVMGSPHPVAMYWGPQYTIIYNEACAPLLGQKHPGAMGSNCADSWSESWDYLKPVFDGARHAGQAVLKQDDRLFIRRHGFLEEIFFNWSIAPVVGSDGSVVALYTPVFETTRRVVNERRMLTLNEVGDRTAVAHTVSDFWEAALKGLEYNEYDVPFALLYSVVNPDSGNGDDNNDDNDDNDDDSDASSVSSNNVCNLPQVVLEGSLGVPGGHAAAVSALDLRTSNEGFAPYMRQAMKASTGGSPSSSPSTVVLSAENGKLPTNLLVGLQGERGFDDPCRTVVVFPVQHPGASSTGTDSPASTRVSAFIVMGTNPRRPYNRDYSLFVHLLARQLTASLASVVLFEEEVRRSQRAAFRAAKDRQELSQQLRIRTKQAMDSETKFMRMAEFTPVGMFVTDGAGRITYCNDMWWQISRHPRQDAAASPNSASSTLTPVFVTEPSGTEYSSLWSTWMDSVLEEDQEALAVVWKRLVQDKVAVTHEFRFKRMTSVPTDGNEPVETATWVLLRAYPEKDDNGDLKGIFGCITDISQQKLAEEFQIQLRKEAVEHKRQQENFIDITSHEMRNPLSAILQTVDEITMSIADFRAEVARGAPANYDGVFDGILEASNTISLCTNHQRRIVDDVLTLSKLDSRLLPITPVAAQPVAVIRGTLKIFAAEFTAHDIHCILRVQPSYQSIVGSDAWVKMDPSRLNQILINLLSNAIKFTQHRKERSIVISIAASDGDSDPTESDVAGSTAGSIAELSYLPRRQETPELADGPDWGKGRLVNLHIAVSDTGRGLHGHEKTTLFQLFSQTSPRTHVQYGGPGLGLHISRTLAELQGGQIGVASRRDHGSTFAFYIKCRKASSSPADAQSGPSSLPAIAADPLVPGHSSPIVAFTPAESRSGRGACKSETATIAAPTLLSHLPSPPILIDGSLPSTPDRPISAPAFPETQAPPAVTTNSTSAWLSMPSLDVLIVEDNIVNQRVLQRQLTKCGNRTVVANHGGEALEILRRSSFWRTADETGRAYGPEAGPGAHLAVGTTSDGDTTPTANATSAPASEPPLGTNISVVLLDLEMPVMDGMTCARAIRALERSGALRRHVPIIAVTAYARLEQIESAKAAGIDEVISKPFRLAQLMPTIQDLVAKYETT